MKPNQATHMGTVIDFPEIRSAERAVCELCGAEISTTNGGYYNGPTFVSFEKLLDLHMEQRHPNICVLPAKGERWIAA